MTRIINDHLSCHIITEGLIGTENQCVGVANALGVDAQVKRVSLKHPWKVFSPYLGLENSKTFIPALEGPWPDIIITSGRKSIAISRYIKKMSGGKTVTIHIQDPRVSSKYFDLVAVPAHDPMRGDNVIVTKASPNKITQEKLEAARGELPELGIPPSPRVAVLIGGNSKAYKMTDKITQGFAQKISDLQGFSLMITCSRRTGEHNRRILEAKLSKPSNYFWDGSGLNPYMALLAWADYILVTADSASMISESCTTGKPVYMIELQGRARRIKKFQQSLIDGGLLRSFSGTLEDFKYEPLNDAQMVADEIVKRFGDKLGINKK